jgi:hypothetical protein
MAHKISPPNVNPNCGKCHKRRAQWERLHAGPRSTTVGRATQFNRGTACEPPHLQHCDGQDGTMEEGSSPAWHTTIHRHPFMAQKKRAVAPHGPLQSTGTPNLHTRRVQQLHGPPQFPGTLAWYKGRGQQPRMAKRLHRHRCMAQGELAASLHASQESAVPPHGKEPDGNPYSP